MAKNNGLLIIGIVVVAFFLLGGTSLLTGLGGGNGNTNPQPDTSGQCPFQPTAAYSTKDVFASTILSGTAYYKVNGLPATTTAATNVNKETSYQYWLQNNSNYYTEPKTLTASCDVNNFVANAWQNTTPTLTSYDLVNKMVTSDGSYNTSMAASARANIEFTYQGVAKKSLIPFGGVLVLEYNATMASVSCTGADITDSNDFHVTYTPTATTHTYRVWKIKPTLDDGSGEVKTIDCQFTNGGSSLGGSLYYATIIPANYYLTNDGNFALDVEQAANDLTTRTGLGTISDTNRWGA